MKFLFILILWSNYHCVILITKDKGDPGSKEGPPDDQGQTIGSSPATQTRLRRDLRNLDQEERNYFQQLPQTTNSKLEHFKFKSRNVGGKKIAIVSFKADPDRDRRSILVPDGEGLLRPRPFAPLRHHHKFMPPFEDENLFSLNRSLAVSNGSPFEDGVQDETREERTLNRIDNSLKNLELLLEEEERRIQEGGELSLRSSDKANGRREKSKKNKKKKKRKKEKKKEKRKNKGENKKKRKSRTKMLGQEACQYKILKKCTKNLGLLPKKNVKNMTEFEKCDQRKEFLECVETRRLRKPCKMRSVARGNLPNLRTWIKKLFWTSSSCLLNESMKRR